MTKSLRIMVVHNWYRSANPSGENRVVERESAALSARGHDVIRFDRHSDEIAQWPLPRKTVLPARIIWSREAHQDLARLKVDVNSVYQKVESLSGGRQQSVAIARAVSFGPKVVIFDEPTANLSATATDRLLETMGELRLHYTTMYLPKMLERIKKTAPPGADLTSWRY